MRYFPQKKKSWEVEEMVGILIISHGRLADAIISSARVLIGGLKKIRGVSIWPKDNEKEVRNRIQKEMAKVDDGDGVLILTDILGGTPTNLTLPLLGKKRV